MSEKSVFTISGAIVLSVAVISSVLYVALPKAVSESVREAVRQADYERMGGQENYELARDFQIRQFEAQKSRMKAELAKPQAQKPSSPAQSAPVKKAEKSGKMTEKNLVALRTGANFEGPADAGISLYEFSDLECPFCKKLHVAGTVSKILASEKGTNAAFKHMPLAFHPKAKPLAEIAACAGISGGAVAEREAISWAFGKDVTPTAEALSEALPGIVGKDVAKKALECVEEGK